jgi:uncharacterized protein involved in response to NO
MRSLENFLQSMFKHPLFYGSFRLFFLLAAIFSIVFIIVWAAIWGQGINLPGQNWGIIVWHGHEMLFGLVLTSAYGFLFTVVPEFTETESLTPKQFFPIVILWLLARIFIYIPGDAGSWIAAGTDLIILGISLVIIIPRLVSPLGRTQSGFGLSLFLLFVIIIGYHTNVILKQNPLSWLRLSVGLWMILIIVSMSRISMRIINSALDLYPDNEKRYIARPPRRNFAIVCITMYSLSEFFLGNVYIQGWFALSAMASILFLLNDWHLGKVIFNRWVFLLYSVYWMMAIGYGLIAYSLFFDISLLSSSKHILFIGAIGISILMVMIISSRSHTGLLLDERSWVPVAIASLVAATVFRFWWGVTPNMFFFYISIFFWVLGYGMYLYYFFGILTKPRPDGLTDDSSPEEIDCRV